MDPFSPLIRATAPPPVMEARRWLAGVDFPDPRPLLNLSQAASYLALAPKSNASMQGISRARADVRREGASDPPPYLQDAHYYGARKLGRGVGYEYPHDLPGGVSEQSLLPEGMEDRRYYEPTERGFEATLRERLATARQKQRKNRE